MTPYSLKLLKFSVVSSDGGHFAQNYCVENIISQDASVYCSKKRHNTNIVLKFEENFPFTITHVIVKAPEHGFNSPIGEGLIFTSYDFPDVSQTSKFDNYDAHMYESYISSHCSSVSSSCNLHPSDPAAYFKSMKNTWCSIQKLPIPRSGNYVVVKLLRSRNDGENVDIQYIGFKGFVGPHAFQDGSLI